MADENLPEVWLRGEQNDYPVLLQPIVFALQQAKEDILKYTVTFQDDDLFKKPGNAASVAFHLQHISGVLDRMFTYASAKQLSTEQLEYLAKEGQNNSENNVNQLVSNVCFQIDLSLDRLKSIDKNSFTEARSVGRQHLPATVFGLLFHAAEHTQRHVGQLLVTVKVLNQ